MPAQCPPPLPPHPLPPHAVPSILAPLHTLCSLVCQFARGLLLISRTERGAVRGWRGYYCHTPGNSPETRCRRPCFHRPEIIGTFNHVSRRSSQQNIITTRHTVRSSTINQEPSLTSRFQAVLHAMSQSFSFQSATLSNT